ncbi:MAG: methyl-accepting chemotaxis protein [Gammaproteobacteria bacterium]|nr:methyl-accepting chemotaxis protein [Gammaproteobacteria bacterium]
MRSIIEICHLNKIAIIDNSSISNRIWFGFGLILAILLFVSLSTLGRFVHLSNGISEVAEEIQPVVLSAQNLETELKAASNALGFYLLTKEEAYKAGYILHLGTASHRINELITMQYVADNEKYSSVVATVQNDLSKLASYKDKMIALANDDMANIPAQRLAAERLNPRAQQLQSMISQMIESDYEEDNPRSKRDEFRQTIYDLRYYNVQLASELRTFLAFRADVNIQNMKAIEEVVQSKLKILQSKESLYTFEQSDLMENFIKVNKEYSAALTEAINIHSTDKYRTDIYLVKTEIGILLAKIETDLGSMVDELKSKITETSNQLQEEAAGASTEVIIWLTIGIVMGVLVAYFMARMITFPINAAVHAMEDLAEGEGDLTRRLNEKGKSEIALMASGFNRFATKVQAMVSQVASGVENLSNVVSDVSNIVDQTQIGSQQQRQQTEQVATAITEMTATVQEVASNANMAADSAQQADEDAKSGQQIVSDTVASINSLASEIETGATVINKLSEDAVSIGSVLDVIKGVAEQTNLLALNAAIEAARAGEQGRGFAVVADEVRTLASRTQESATEIETMIDSLQVQAKAAVAAISQGQEKARSSVEQASTAGQALNEITNSVATISSMNIQIATASEEQSAVAEEINQNVVSISHVAESNAQASDQLAVSSQDLAELAAELQELVSQFKY